MPYIGQPLNAGNLSVQTGTGDGSDTTPIAALNYSVGSSESLAIYLDGVKQAVSTYTASGTVLTFTTAPPNLVGIEVVFLALPISLPTPGDNTVDETKLKDALIADFTEVVVTASDSILLGDATDSGNTKRDTVQGILDLAGWIHLGTGTASASADLEFDATVITSTYSNYMFVLKNIEPATTSQILRAYISSDDGSSYVSSAMYGIAEGKDHAATAVQTLTSNLGYWQMTGVVVVDGGGAAWDLGVSGQFLLVDPSSANRTSAVQTLQYNSTNGMYAFGGHQHAASLAINNIKFQFASGNIATGEIRCYGIKD